MWHKTPLARMAQLSDARGYKRAGPSYKRSVVQVCSDAKRLRHVSQFMASKVVLHDGNLSLDPHNSSDYIRTERYSYLIGNLQLFSQAPSLSVVADACSASEHFLNIVAWNGDIRKAVVCPPQAPGGSFGGPGSPPEQTPIWPRRQPPIWRQRVLPFPG